MSAHPRPWHKNSQFGPGPRHRLCREKRAQYRARLWILLLAGKITARFHDIAERLVHHLGRDGRLDPSHETLAREVGCDVKTVQRAMNRLRELGLVSWVRRIVRVGQAVAQTSNAYVLLLGNPPHIPGLASKGHFVRPTSTIDKSIAYTSMPTASAADRADAQAALARRRAVIEGSLLRKVFRCPIAAP